MEAPAICEVIPRKTFQKKATMFNSTSRAIHILLIFTSMGFYLLFRDTDMAKQPRYWKWYMTEKRGKSQLDQNMRKVSPRACVHTEHLQHIGFPYFGNQMTFISSVSSSFTNQFIQWGKKMDTDTGLRVKAKKLSYNILCHGFFDKVFFNPLRIFPNQTKFMAASAEGTTNTKRKPMMCILMTCHVIIQSFCSTTKTWRPCTSMIHTTNTLCTH